MHILFADTTQLQPSGYLGGLFPLYSLDDVETFLACASKCQVLSFLNDSCLDSTS